MNANQLKQVRLGKAMTQEQMADALGLSWRHYQRLEAGSTPIRRPIALALGVVVKGD